MTISRDRSAAGSGGLLLGAVEEGLDLGPERLTLLPLALGELRQGLGVPDAGELGILLPLVHRCRCRGAVGRRAAVELLGPQGQIGAEPVEGLFPLPGALRVV